VPDAIQNWYLPRILPDRWLDKLIGKRLVPTDSIESANTVRDDVATVVNASSIAAAQDASRSQIFPTDDFI
jgi:hypothetical protein